ncbi:glutaconate CoA-transferase [Desulfosarcina sp. OttesenSCG-928-A07]|nr:glutaconate CoA-transferase [Desulfosarcina sp. OttesenSCG-928-G17]MDL2328964.1 glutaconate CoA-transferase [Desulfosarcina sp. OttesenSCG-928-A07]
MEHSTDFSTTELMAVVVSQQIRNDDVAFIGVGIPLLAGILAVSTHAPEAVLIYEGGGIGARTRRLPWTISDNPTTDNAISAQTMWRVFSDQQRGYITLGIIGGAEIDRFGNLNTTVILGDGYTYEHPRIRLPGSGGANDIASSVGRTVIMMRLQKKKFVNKLQFITSPGYLGGPGAREAAGLVGGGPEAVITDKCVFKFDPETKEMVLCSVYPGYTASDIQECVDWELRVARNLETIHPPTADQIRILRAYDPMGFVLSSKTNIGQNGFEDFCDRVQQGYEAITLTPEA